MLQKTTLLKTKGAVAIDNRFNIWQFDCLIRSVQLVATKFERICLFWVLVVIVAVVVVVFVLVVLVAFFFFRTPPHSERSEHWVITVVGHIWIWHKDCWSASAALVGVVFSNVDVVVVVVVVVVVIATFIPRVRTLKWKICISNLTKPSKANKCATLD